MKRLVVGSAVAVVVALLVSGSAPVTRAQEAMPWMRVDIMEVIPDQLDEFIETQLEQVNPALRRAGVPWRSAWRTAEFGNLYERMFVTPMDDLAELDRGGPLAFALDRRDLERIDERVRRTISGHRSYALRYRPELSVESPNAGGLALAWITTLEVAPGRLADWQAFMRERLPLFRGDNVVFGMYERYLGTGGGRVAARREPFELHRAQRPHHHAARPGRTDQRHRGRTGRRGPLGGAHRAAVRPRAELLGSGRGARWRSVPVGDPGAATVGRRRVLPDPEPLTRHPRNSVLRGGPMGAKVGS